jgi:hypothetical protein
MGRAGDRGEGQNQSPWPRKEAELDEEERRAVGGANAFRNPAGPNFETRSLASGLAHWRSRVLGDTVHSDRTAKFWGTERETRLPATTLIRQTAQTISDAGVATPLQIFEHGRYGTASFDDA